MAREADRMTDSGRPVSSGAIPQEVYGVWEHNWEDDTLIGLYWAEEDAVQKAEAGGGWPGLDGGAAKWNVEPHAIHGAKAEASLARYATLVARLREHADADDHLRRVATTGDY